MIDGDGVFAESDIPKGTIVWQYTDGHDKKMTKEDLKEMMAGGASFKPSQVPKKDLGLLAEMARRQELDSNLIESFREIYLSIEQPVEPRHPQ